jgi:hypothetical protein
MSFDVVGFVVSIVGSAIMGTALSVVVWSRSTLEARMNGAETSVARRLVYAAHAGLVLVAIGVIILSGAFVVKFAPGLLESALGFVLGFITVCGSLWLLVRRNRGA